MVYKIKDENEYRKAFFNNDDILKFINGRPFNLDISRPDYIELDGDTFYVLDHIADTRVWFTKFELAKYCEEIDDLVIWLCKKCGFSSSEDALQEFNKSKLLQIKQLEEQIETLKSQLAR